jgi:hypothetical protein
MVILRMVIQRMVIQRMVILRMVILRFYKSGKGILSRLWTSRDFWKSENWKVGKLRTQDSKNTGMDLAGI